MWLLGFSGSYPSTAGLFALAWRFDTIEMPPRIPFSMKRCWSWSVSSSSYTPVFLRRASQDRPVVRRVQPVLFLGGLSKVLKYIGKEQHVGPAVEVGVVAQGFTPEGLPDPLGMHVVTITDILIRELGVEGLLRWKLGLLEALPGVYALIGVHAFAHEQRALLVVWLISGCDLEGLGLICGYQLVEGGLQELGAIDQAQLSQGEADVPLCVVGDAAHPPLHLGYRLHQQVAVVPSQVVEHNWYGSGLRSLRLQAL